MQTFNILEQQGKLRNLLVYWYGKKADIDDMLQEILIKIQDNIHTFKGESKLDTWIYRVARNTSINYCRDYLNRNKTLPLENAKNVSCDGCFTEGTQNRNYLAYVLLLARKLPKIQRSIFYCVQVKGMSYKSTAKQLNRSIKGIGAQLGRAKLNIQKQIRVEERKETNYECYSIK
jgi:RNA polymerase sigma-70 factor, ECF subfamily